MMILLYHFIFMPFKTWRDHDWSLSWLLRSAWCRVDIPYERKVESLHLNIENVPIENVYESNFLGLTTNKNMNWKSNINKITKEISKGMGVLNKLKHFLPLNSKILIYNSLISTHLTFCKGILYDWIVKLENEAVRMISLSKCNA